MKTPHQEYLAACRKRRDAIRAARKRGEKLEALAAEYGISKQRISAIAKGVKAK